MMPSKAEQQIDMRSKLIECLGDWYWPHLTGTIGEPDWFPGTLLDFFSRLQDRIEKEIKDGS